MRETNKGKAIKNPTENKLLVEDIFIEYILSFSEGHFEGKKNT